MKELFTVVNNLRGLDLKYGILNIKQGSQSSNGAPKVQLRVGCKNIKKYFDESNKNLLECFSRIKDVLHLYPSNGLCDFC